MGGGQGQSRAVVSRMFTAAHCTMERRNKRIVECRFFFVILFESRVFFLIVGVEALYGVSVEGRFITSQARIDLERLVRAEEVHSAMGPPKPHHRHDVRVRRFFGVDSAKRRQQQRAAAKNEHRGKTKTKLMSQQTNPVPTTSYLLVKSDEAILERSHS
jgi:hypothetical protein